MQALFQFSSASSFFPESFGFRSTGRRTVCHLDGPFEVHRCPRKSKLRHDPKCTTLGHAALFMYLYVSISCHSGLLEFLASSTGH